MFNYDRLKQAIEESGKTKTYLCKQLGRQSYYLRDVMKQKSEIPLHYQEILASELGVTVGYLNDLEEKSPPSEKENGLDETKREFMMLLDEITSDQEVLLRLQMKAWIEQNRQQKSAAPLSGAEKVP